MCASTESQQISMIAEYTLFNRDKYPSRWRGGDPA
jgi:hypothetical protein